MKTIVHVNKFNIARNNKGANLPVITVKTYKSNTYARRVKVHGPSEVIYNPIKPLSCGAKVWIETQGAVEILES